MVSRSMVARRLYVDPSAGAGRAGEFEMTRTWLKLPERFWGHLFSLNAQQVNIETSSPSVHFVYSVLLWEDDSDGFVRFVQAAEGSIAKMTIDILEEDGCGAFKRTAAVYSP
jgi:hypothetical protein